MVKKKEKKRKEKATEQIAQIQVFFFPERKESTDNRYNMKCECAREDVNLE